MKKLIPQSFKNIYHLCQAVWANICFGFPSRKIKIIGITGTNGKTTTTQLVTKILEEAGYKVAMASTINFKLADEEWINKTKFTTLSAWQVQKFIKKAVDKKCDYLVLETSSHSLDQYRVWGVDYDGAVITNVTREHLDYHKTMEVYREAKLKLFQKSKRIIINLDMENPQEFYNFQGKEMIYGYTTKNEIVDKENLVVIRAKNIEMFTKSSTFKVDDDEFVLNLPGKFNIENALAAICVGIVEGIDNKIIKKALEKIANISGRMEYIANDKDLNIVVDYAVTPDSLEKLYDLVKTINKDNKKVIAVFGSCGERDRGKRPIMGEIVSKNADIVIVTNEDPYNENPMQIIDEVASGIKNKIEGKDFYKIFDRREAINKSLNLANQGDFVIVTGKGAEETMAIGEKRIPWNDKQVILEELKNIKIVD
ncbi:MAG: UDP-N-acetylmuramoyl-L-alanyl-D-glutamate--2,6-diaminopimelate ligase [Parcubacteria group bacterium]|jgi:UDP-N-acetylmuramoyl-L-alanyl-D-glutamate--2,6-diaminopimelate ligase